MIPPDTRKDLIVLAADLNMKLAFTHLLKRHHSLGIRPISVDVIIHEHRDPGVFRDAHNTLQAQCRNYRYSIAVCDREGCGGEHLTREQLEAIIKGNLSRHWPDRSAAIVIDPELEAWVWTESNALVQAIGWSGTFSALRDWLQQTGFDFNGPVKPTKPKEALERVLRHNQKKRSSALYGKLSSTVTLTSCTDPAFEKLCKVLRSWFSPAA